LSVPSATFDWGIKLSYLCEETTSDFRVIDTNILINPDERPSYLPVDQSLIKLLSGGIRVETDTDEFMSVMTKSSGSGGAHVGCIPEFTTIAIPVAAILGLLFLFSRRRKKGKVISQEK